jgi:hypothetical protein
MRWKASAASPRLLVQGHPVDPLSGGDWEGRCDAEVHQRSQSDARRNYALYALETAVRHVFSAGANLEQMLGMKERHRGSMAMIGLPNHGLSRMVELSGIRTISVRSPK